MSMPGSRSSRRLATAAVGALLLILSLACGGSEPPVVATPPAPPPEPPFQPESVRVDLGASGTHVTLLTTEAGGFTLDGEPFVGGSEVTAQDGSVYVLDLADGSWTATFRPALVSVPLGVSGESLDLSTRDGGGYLLDGEDFPGGSLVETAIGQYRLDLSDGSWTATFVERTVAVELGSSGLSVQLTRVEQGWTADGRQVTGDWVYSLPTGDRYRLSLSDGQWTAMFVEETVAVALGTSGTSIDLTRGEEGWTFDGGDVPAEWVHDLGGGRRYRLQLSGGAWTATFIAETVLIDLGASGSAIELTRVEDGWTADGRSVPDSWTHVARNDLRYRLVLADGDWSASYVPEIEQIGNLGVFARAREGGGGYDLVGATGSLDRSGSGSISLLGYQYRVSRIADGTLQAVLLDSLISAAAGDVELSLADGRLELGLPLLDDLVVDFPLGELYSEGFPFGVGRHSPRRSSAG